MVEEIRKAFAVLYRAFFGSDPFRTQDEADVWFGFLEVVPSQRHKALIEAVASARGKARYRPGLEDFKRAWDNMTGGFGRGISSHFCPHCWNGHILVLGYYDDGGAWVLCDELVEGHEPTIGIARGVHSRAFPCACDSGRKLSDFGDNRAAIARVDWVLDRKRAWGIEDTYLIDGIEVNRRWHWAVASRLGDLILAATAASREEKGGGSCTPAS